MSKLPEQNRFLDVSDYARPAARWLVRVLLPTPVSSIQLTLLFLVAGVSAAYSIYEGHYVAAASLLLVKNALDAADGEMARAREHPSHLGRYLDSVFDFLINLLVVAAIYAVAGGPIWLPVAAFLCLELQGTVFNYYYVVQRTICDGERTSRINETGRPVAFAYESQRAVNVIHAAYVACYGAFDQLMIRVERAALRDQPLPSWFMTLVSSMGLGFQLLLVAAFLVADRVDLILPFFVLYTAWGAGIILIRKAFVRPDALAEADAPPRRW